MTREECVANPASPVKRCHQSVGTHDHGALGQLVVVLFNSFEIVSRRISLADGSRSEVHDLVTVTAYVGVQLRHAEVCPISTYHCEHVPKGVRPLQRGRREPLSQRQRRARLYFVMVPSMSETTIESVWSQTNILAAHATTPEVDRENVTAFAPGLRSSCFSWSEVSLSVFAYFFFS